MGGNQISVLKNSSVNFLSFFDLMTPLWLLLLPLQSMTSHFPLLHLKYIAVVASCYIFILEISRLEKICLEKLVGVQILQTGWSFRWISASMGEQLHLPTLLSLPPTLCHHFVDEDPGTLAWSHLSPYGQCSSQSTGSWLCSSLLLLLSLHLKEYQGILEAESYFYLAIRKDVSDHQ